MTELKSFPQEWQAPSVIPALGQAASFGADSELFVRFYEFKEYNHFASEKAGYKMFDKKLYVRIQRPGDKFCIVIREAKNSDFIRFPLQYEAFKSGKTERLGTPLMEWDVYMSEAELAVLSAYGIEYVHQVAQLNEVQAQALGNNARHLVTRAKFDTQDVEEKKKASELQAKLDEISEKHSLEMKEMEERFQKLLEGKSSTTSKKGKGKNSDSDLVLGDDA